jgi:hypothetical protein
LYPKTRKNKQQNFMFRFLILAFCCIYLPVNAELGQQSDPESGEKNQRQEIIKEAWKDKK